MGVAVEIDAGDLATWPDFQAAFARARGFPDFCGRDMNAWIDCLTAVDDADAGLSTVNVSRGDILTVMPKNYRQFRSAAPGIPEALNECTALVNWRPIETGEPPVLALACRS
ncbi:MAG: barstar family protein [Rhodobacteraceae bacterium]|nr:barstar family protein [Paracoccaceae bacterium]